jgi:outer membrane protein assembly factor BamB/tetratricopeptide (TPR) repeat protein
LALFGLTAATAILCGGGLVHAQNRPAQKFTPDSSSDAEKLLINAANLARDRQWSEAVNIYQRVIDQYGARVALIPRDDDRNDPQNEFLLYVDQRRFCHEAIAHLPPEARAVYRNRVDGLAGRWFEEGVRLRDRALLRRVVDQAFCSSWGDDALELLGDLSFQDGRYEDALGAYSRLVADSSGGPDILVHPDPSVELARIAAKKILCRAAAGVAVPTKADLAELDRRYPGAEGALAGRKGPYREIIAEALASDHLAPPAQAESWWPSFAGAVSRTRVVPGPIDVGSTQWRVDLEKVSPTRQPTFSTRGIGSAVGVSSSAPERLLAFHPIVLGDQVIVCDGSRVFAYNLNDRPAESDATGPRPVEHVWKYDPENSAQGPQARSFPMMIPRYTLTAVGQTIYARIGAMNAAFVGAMGNLGGRSSSSIIALDWNAQGKLLWEAKSTKIALPNQPAERNGNNRTVSFEGTPVADARSVYVAVTDRREQTATYIACLDAATGSSRWVRYLGTASPDVDAFFGMPMQFGMTAPGDFNHRLLSLDGPTIYYQTNLGAVIALEAETGATLWVATYPRQETTNHLGNGGDRDLNPAVVHGGRVIVAPSDADAIFAFDAASGRLLWKSDPIADDIKLTHLLGVAKDRLVATGNRVLLFDVKTGKLVHAWPDMANKAMEGYGRGLLAGDYIYWPTLNEIQVLDQRTALRAEPPIKLFETYRTKGGNLVAGDGYLIVAQQDGMVVFCQNSRLIERYKNEIAMAPERAPSYFRLARAAEAVGQDPLALEMYEQATKRSRAGETIDGAPLIGTARDHRFALLLKLAARDRKASHWDQASGRLEIAASVARSDPERLRARLAQADVALDAGRPRDAVSICEQLLGDERVRPLPVAADGQRTIRADLYIADRLNAIVTAHGRGVFEAHDREARRRYERALAAKDPRLVDQVCREFPVATVVPEALASLGELYESTHRWVDAAHAYNRLLLAARDDDSRAWAMWRTAQVFEARKLFVAARDRYLDLAARYPNAQLRGPGKSGTVAESVASELAREPYVHLAVERAVPRLSVPLVRRWQWQSSGSEPVRVLAATGVAPSLDAGRLFLVEKTGLRILDPATGLPRALAELGEPPIWASYMSDKLIAATPHQIVALELGQGIVQWRYDLSRTGKDRSRPDPFAAKNDDAPPAADGVTDALSDFQLMKGRVFFLKGQRELVALDGDSGAVDWSFSSPGGQIVSHFYIGADRSILEVDKPNHLLVLKTDDGQPISRTPLDENERLERDPLPLDDDSVVLVSDRRTVKRFDLAKGEVAWTYRESTDLPVNGPPRVLGNAEHLLVVHDGRLLIRLDPATGSKRWSCPLGFEDLSARPAAMALDEKHFYCVNKEIEMRVLRQTIRAIALEDGKSVWSRHLGGPKDTGWSLFLTQAYVIACPDDRIEGASSNAAEGSESEKLPALMMPLSIRRRDTGVLVQRFVLPSTRADVTFRADARGALAATSRGCWGFGSRENTAAAVSEKGH